MIRQGACLPPLARPPSTSRTMRSAPPPAAPGHAPPRALTVGVAGHVDHGKTSLVRALTGVNTDALREEQRRGISIELGFAPLQLETRVGPVTVGFVDMPGHERFVRRMISGAAGIDAVLLVVAADEGVMPQGREHLAICDLLGVRRGAVALTKVDLADELLLELVAEDVGELLADGPLAGAPTLHFSTTDVPTWRTRFLAELGALVADWVEAQQGGSAAARPFRMPVDRSFVLPGRGTVVTGTAAEGTVALDDQLMAWPGGATFRVRGAQRHGESVSSFAAPGRVALDLAGAALADVPVGAVLAKPGGVLETRRVDASLRVLDHVRKPLKARHRAMVHIGTSHVEASITSLTGEPMGAHEPHLVQIHLDQPRAIAPGERFIVRSSATDPRFGQTIAGGCVLHPAPPRHRLCDAEVLAALGDLLDGDDPARVAASVAIARGSGLSDAELALRLQLAPALLSKAVKAALSQGKIRKFGSPPRYLVPGAVSALEARIVAVVAAVHAERPDLPGVDEPDLARKVGAWLDAGMIQGVVHGLLRRGALVRVGPHLAQVDFKPRLLRARPRVRAALVDAVTGHGLAPPIGNALRDAVTALCPAPAEELELAIREESDAGTVTVIRSGFVVPTETLAAAVAEVFERFVPAERFSTGELKDVLGLTRKHLIPVAEFLDNARLTIRDPDGNRRFRGNALERWQAGDAVWPAER